MVDVLQPLGTPAALFSYSNSPLGLYGNLHVCQDRLAFLSKESFVVVACGPDGAPVGRAKLGLRDKALVVCALHACQLPGVASSLVVAFTSGVLQIWNLQTDLIASAPFTLPLVGVPVPVVRAICRVARGDGGWGLAFGLSDGTIALAGVDGSGGSLSLSSLPSPPPLPAASLDGVLSICSTSAALPPSPPPAATGCDILYWSDASGALLSLPLTPPPLAAPTPLSAIPGDAVTTLASGGPTPGAAVAAGYLSGKLRLHAAGGAGGYYVACEVDAHVRALTALAWRPGVNDAEGRHSSLLVTVGEDTCVLVWGVAFTSATAPPRLRLMASRIVPDAALFGVALTRGRREGDGAGGGPVGGVVYAAALDRDGVECFALPDACAATC